MRVRPSAISLLCVMVLLVGAAETSAGPVLDGIRQSGKIRSPVPDIWPPFVIQDPNGELGGFDVEVLREMGRRMGVEVEYVYAADGSIVTWDEQTSGQWNGRYDIVVNSMTPTAKRAERLIFPASYYFGMGALVIHRDNTTIDKPADASGKRIGVLKSSIYEYYIRRQPFGIVDAPPVTYKIDDPVVVTYDHEEQVWDALAKGDGMELDGMINNIPVALAQIKAGMPLKIVGQTLYRVPQSVAIQPGDEEFAALIKDTIEQMRSDGTLTKMSMKWFDFDVTQP